MLLLLLLPRRAGGRLERMNIVAVAEEFAFAQWSRDLGAAQRRLLLVNPDADHTAHQQQHKEKHQNVEHHASTGGGGEEEDGEDDHHHDDQTCERGARLD